MDDPSLDEEVHPTIVVLLRKLKEIGGKWKYSRVWGATWGIFFTEGKVLEWYLKLMMPTVASSFSELGAKYAHCSNQESKIRMFDLQLGYKQTIKKSASPGKESSKANIFSRWRHPQQVSLLGAVYFKHIKNAARISKVESQIWYMSNHVKSVNSKRFHLRCFISSLMMLLSGAQINTEPEPPRFRQYDQDRDGVWSSGELSFLVLQATFLFNHHLRAPFGSTCFAVPKIQELRCKVWVVTFKMVMWRPWWKWNLALEQVHHTSSHEVDVWYDQVITVHNWCTYHLYTKDIWDVEYESLV